MNHPLQICLILGTSAALTVSAAAQKIIFAEDFNSYREGGFEPALAGKAEPYSIVVFEAVSSVGMIVPGDRSRKTTRNLELTAELKSPGLNVAGYGWRPEKQPRVKEGREGEDEEKRPVRKDAAAKDLANYTLSFDIALLGGPGFSKDAINLDVNVIGETNGTGTKLNPDVSQLAVGGGFQRISIALDKGGKFLESPALDPTDSRFKIEFNIVGSVSAATVQKIAIDNIQLTMNRAQGK